MEDFASLLEEFENSVPQKGPKVGDQVTGPIITMNNEYAFVGLGGKAEGVIELEQLRDMDGALTKEVGEQVTARVVSLKGGSIQLACKVGQGPNAIDEYSAAFEHQMPVEGMVKESNKGGFTISLSGARAFCPISQIDNKFVEVPDEYIGKKFEFLITKLEMGRGDRIDIVVSRRALLDKENAHLAKELRQQLKVGSVLKGTVSTIKPYGAFVDLGGLEGMIHVSELSQSRVSDPNEVLKVGDKVEVMVQRIDPSPDGKKSERIALSLKALEKSPWDDAMDRFPVGSKFKGTVVRLQPFGAFVEIDKGLEGLVHISELGAKKRIHHPRDVVAVGDEVLATILRVDPGNQRLALTLKDADDADGAMALDIAMHQDKSNKQGLGTLGDLLAKSKNLSK